LPSCERIVVKRAISLTCLRRGVQKRSGLLDDASMNWFRLREHHSSLHAR